MFRRGKQGGQNSCRGSQPLRAGIQELGQGWWDSRPLWEKRLFHKQGGPGLWELYQQELYPGEIDREQDIILE